MKKTMLALIILASLIPGILAVVQYFENEKKEAQAQNNEKALNSKIDSLKFDNSDLRDRLNVLTNDNLKLSQQLTRTALELNNNVIGASDLSIEINNIKNTEFRFRFYNNSDLPVNNAHITIENYSEIKKCEVLKETEDKVFIPATCYERHFIKQTGVNLNPQGGIIFDQKSFDFHTGYMCFAITIETRKKILIYHLAYQIIDNKLVRSYRKYNLVNRRKKILMSEENHLKVKDDFWENNFYLKILYTI